MMLARPPRRGVVFRWRAVLCDRDGSALIEAAIAIPVLLFLVMGVIEFSWFLYQSHQVATGIRDAARYLARTGNPAESANQATARHLATSGQVSGGTARVRGFTDETISFCVGGAGGGCASQCAGVPVTPSGNPCGTAQGCRGAPVSVVVASTSFPEQSLGFFEVLGLKPPTFCLWHAERALPDAAAVN
jgi:Flp pilus assembly protein TadG